MAEIEVVANKLTAGLTSLRLNELEVAKEIHRNIVYLVSLQVPVPSKEENGQLAILTVLEGLEAHQKLIEILCKYHLQTSGHVDSEILRQILASRGVEKELITSICFLFDSSKEQEIDEPTFRFWVTELAEHVRSIPIADALVNATQALETQWVDPHSKIIHRGAEGAMAILDEVRGLPGMTDQNILAMPSGNIRTEFNEIIEEVDQAASGVRPAGAIFSGYKFVDEVTNGNSPGDVILVGAYTGEGKTQFALNWAWYAAVETGRNVLYITLETARPTCRRRLICRHTNKPGVGKMGGVPYDNIKTGNFADDKERGVFVSSLQDFCTNPSYGVIDVAQATEGMTVEEVGRKAAAFQDNFGVELHLLVVDYLALMGSSRRRSGRREELNDILREFKALTTSFDRGRGVVGLAPHQTKQERREIVKPELGKFYTIRDFADTSEAGKTVDLGIMLLRTDELKEQHELAAALVKYRDADTMSEIVRLYERFSSSFVGNMQQSN